MATHGMGPTEDREPFFWLSFCDGSLPEGSQFLGAAIINAASLPEAITASWLNGSNPGGEIGAIELDGDAPIPPEYIGRLLSKPEIDRLNEIMEKRGVN